MEAAKRPILGRVGPAHGAGRARAVALGIFLSFWAAGCKDTAHVTGEGAAGTAGHVAGGGGAVGAAGHVAGGGSSNCYLRGAYPDGDGDGWGPEAVTEPIAEFEYCCDDPPEGYAWSYGDCDDNNADISPGVLDEWGDGIDSDCDGSDDPAGCPEAMTADDLPPSASPPCQGPDLSVASVFSCPTICLATSYVQLANRGDARAQGDVTVNVGESETVGPYPIDLAPGEVSAPLLLFLGPGQIEFSVDPGTIADCDPANDQGVHDAPNTFCP